MNHPFVPADLILINGSIHTQNQIQPFAEALAVKGNRILAVGSSDMIATFSDADTQTLDLGGCTVIPGFTDAHFHFYEWALSRRHIDLSNTRSLEDSMQKVKDFSRGRSPEKWLIGQGWNEADWEEKKMPAAKDIDRIVSHIPVILWRCDLHLAVVNSKAMKLSGIGRDTPDPPKGLIERDGEGRPTGILRELAINIVRDRIPPPSDQEIVEALSSAIREAHSLGITGIHDIRLMNDPDGARALRCWQRLNASGRLDLRCHVTLPGHRIDDAIGLGLRTGLGDDRLRIGHLKYFADGGMGARTAWMIEPYLDAEIGMPMVSMDELYANVWDAHNAGLSVMIHAVGDRANREVIRLYTELYKKLEKKAVDPESRPCMAHRIEHVQMIHPDDLEPLSALNIAVSVTPPNMILDINTVDQSVGTRGRRAYAFRDLVETNISVMFSSDCPVCDPDPLSGIQAAVTRCRENGTPKGGWYPESKVSLDQAIAAYTRIPAQASASGHQVGSLVAGKLADIIVLDRNIFSIDPMHLAKVKVDLTLFDGIIRINKISSDPSFRISTRNR